MSVLPPIRKSTATGGSLPVWRQHTNNDNAPVTWLCPESRVNLILLLFRRLNVTKVGTSFGAECLDGIDLRGAVSRKICGDGSAKQENECNGDEGECVVGGDSVEIAADESRGG